MPDATPPQIPWWHDFTKIMLLITTLFSGFAAIQSKCNGERADDGFNHISQRQEEQVQTAAVIKEDLHVAAAITEKKLDKIVEKTADVKNTVQVIESKLPEKK